MLFSPPHAAGQVGGVLSSFYRGAAGISSPAPEPQSGDLQFIGR